MKKLRIKPESGWNVANKLKIYSLALLTLLAALGEVGCNNDSDMTKTSKQRDKTNENLKSLRETEAARQKDRIDAWNVYVEAISARETAEQDSIDAVKDVKDEANRL
jgi:hypothetical protein